MRAEIRRQAVHLSGLGFIALAQFIQKEIVVYFFIIAATLLFYSLYISWTQRKLNRLLELETKIRKFIIKFEREEAKWPFIGAFWFFFGCGLAFLIFPLPIASGACIMLVIGDGLATLIGIRFGRHPILGKKSLEGSLVFFAGSLTAIIFLPFTLVLLGAVLATGIELIPDLSNLKRLKEKGLLDDNLLIPILTGLVLYVAQIIF